jgi:hypothetical protein
VDPGNKKPRFETEVSRKSKCEKECRGGKVEKGNTDIMNGKMNQRKVGYYYLNNFLWIDGMAYGKCCFFL